MANTYSQVNIHCVFTVYGRENAITRNFREDLFKYMWGILKNDNVYPLAIGGWKDHVHVFFELPMDKKVSDIMSHLKSVSSKWVNGHTWVKGKFRWQNGYGAFSYSRSQRNNVIQYIMKQEEHHSIKTFKQEYLELLEKFGIEFREEYLFEFYDE